MNELKHIINGIEVTILVVTEQDKDIRKAALNRALQFRSKNSFYSRDEIEDRDYPELIEFLDSNGVDDFVVVYECHNG